VFGNQKMLLMRVVHRIAALVLAVCGLTAVPAVVGPSVADAVPGGYPALTAKQAAFLNTVVEPARSSQRTYGVPASATVAQAILETGWGGSRLARTANNYFGMTCGAWPPGTIATGCREGPDRFCDRTGCRAGTARFRVYRSMGDSFRDHGLRLATVPRYAVAYGQRGNPDRFVVEIHRAGYATDPAYARTLIRIMVKYHLYRYNTR
jgi:flagellar protein FlgJ